MRKVSLVFIVLGLSAFLLNVSAAKEPPMDKKGKWGISLSASGLSNLGIGLYQGGLGVKHWFSDRFVMKTVLGVSGKSRITYSQTPGYSDSKINQASFSLSLGSELHFIQDSRFSPYLYTGFSLTSSTSTNYNSIPANPVPGTPVKDHLSTVIFGLDSAIGLEYLFSKHFSLAGEYQFGLSFQTDKAKSTVVLGPNVTDPPERKTRYFTAGAKTSSLILTYYF